MKKISITTSFKPLKIYIRSAEPSINTSVNFGCYILYLIEFCLEIFARLKAAFYLP